MRQGNFIRESLLLLLDGFSVCETNTRTGMVATVDHKYLNTLFLSEYVYCTFIMLNETEKGGSGIPRTKYLSPNFV